MSTATQELLTVSQAAELLGIAEPTVRKLCASGELPAAKLGKRWYVSQKRLFTILGLYSERGTV